MQFHSTAPSPTPGTDAAMYPWSTHQGLFDQMAALERRKKKKFQNGDPGHEVICSVWSDAHAIGS